MTGPLSDAARVGGVLTRPGAGGVSLPRDWSSMRELRQARGLSQVRLAELSGVSERTVRAIERGGVERPQHESLRRIAAVLAYGASHQKRLVDRWTGLTAERTADDVGLPDADTLLQRIRLRAPGDGGLRTSLTAELVIGADGMPVTCHYLHVHEPMKPSGEPVVWKLMGGMPFELPSIRFEVTAGGVLDDFLVHGDVAALAIRPDPAMDQEVPFVVGYTLDFRDAVRLDGATNDEWMFGSLAPLQLFALAVRFSGPVPQRAWSVRGETAATAERVRLLPVGADGGVQLVLHDVLGVLGIQWEWGEDAPARRR